METPHHHLISHETVENKGNVVSVNHCEQIALAEALGAGIVIVQFVDGLPQVCVSEVYL